MPQATVPNQVVIAFKPDTSQQQRDAYIASFEGQVTQRLYSLNTVVVTLPSASAEEAPPPSDIVAAAEPDYYVSAQVVVPPNDPYFDQQWALPVIGAPEAWLELPADAPQVTVAVIDSGICADHPDLAGRVLPGWDFVEDDATPQDAFGHGCGVAGIIAANVDDGIGMAGVTPNALILPLLVLDASGIGTYSDVAAALLYAADHGAEVVNLSLGGANPSSVLEQAVNYAADKGVTVVAAAGNTGNTSAVLYPAAYEPVISVGSVDQNLQVSSFSSGGTNVDLLAPGRDVLSLKPDGGYTTMSGTSFAAPYVAGMYALGADVNVSYQPTSVPTEMAIPEANGTPSSVGDLAVDLSAGMPPVGNQGDQGSCVGWALAYYYKSYQERVEHNWAYSDSTIFSPSYIYNQFATSNISGMLVVDGLQLIVSQGVAPLASFPYDDQDWQTQPSESAQTTASNYKAKSYEVLQNISNSDLEILKSHLDDGDPFVMDIPLYSQYQLVGWNITLVTDIPTVISVPSASNLFQVQEYRHAITIVGYDDTLQRFKFVNSWGTGWGENGYGYVTYGYVVEMGTNAYFMLDADSPPSDTTPLPARGSARPLTLRSTRRV